MTKHWRYLVYLLTHKWYVFVECCRLGIPLAGIVHDWSKFLPSEWRPYAEKFFDPQLPSTETLAALRLFGAAELAPFGFFVQDRFATAWLLHQRRNPHHWNYWVSVNDSGVLATIPMPDRYRREMWADWVGAGRAITGRREVVEWYRRTADKMLLHPETRAWVERRVELEDLRARAYRQVAS